MKLESSKRELILPFQSMPRRGVIVHRVGTMGTLFEVVGSISIHFD